MQCKSLWIKASAKCINVKKIYSVIHNSFEYVGCLLSSLVILCISESVLSGSSSAPHLSDGGVGLAPHISSVSETPANTHRPTAAKLFSNNEGGA